MEYNRIVSVTGLSGLFELVSSKADGGVVRSLEDNSRKFVSSRLHNFSHLEGIEVYTKQGNVNLSEVFLAMKESTESLPDSKSDINALRAYFEKVYPDMDFERVYASDMKKMIKWLNILIANHIEIHKPEEGEPDHSGDALKNTAKETRDNSIAASKSTSVKSSAPAKKVNAPRKMA